MKYDKSPTVTVRFNLNVNHLIEHFRGTRRKVHRCHKFTLRVLEGVEEHSYKVPHKDHLLDAV